MAKLDDNDQYENRLEIIGSKGHVYIVAQHKVKRYWCCSCPGWKSRRKCKHLREMGLPEECVPYEMKKKNDFTAGYKQVNKSGNPSDWAKEMEKIRPLEKAPEKAKRVFDFDDEEASK
jgi:hypothetical protein